MFPHVRAFEGSIRQRHCVQISTNFHSRAVGPVPGCPWTAWSCGRRLSRPVQVRRPDVRGGRPSDPVRLQGRLRARSGGGHTIAARPVDDQDRRPGDRPGGGAAPGLVPPPRDAAATVDTDHIGAEADEGHAWAYTDKQTQPSTPLRRIWAYFTLRRDHGTRSRHPVQVAPVE